VTIVPYPTIAHHWSDNYLREVANNADQIAVMAYDSGLFFPSDYRSWMIYQVQGIAQALAQLNISVLIGAPVSEEWTPSHNTTTEYLTNALYGIRAGLSGSAHPQVVDGVAIYPYWEVSADEWVALDEFPSL
jgi:hypothetical protein